MPDPTVREMLFAKVDELIPKVATLLAEIRTATEQLEPERARSCRSALTMADVMVDEIRLRAHARPLDSDDQLFQPITCRPSASTGILTPSA
jgi:hypothetical protein